jgi:hypothetical protein
VGGRRRGSSGGLAGAGIPALVALRQARIQALADRNATQAELLGRIAQVATQSEYGVLDTRQQLRALLYELSVTGTSKQVRQVAKDWLRDLRGDSSKHTEQGIRRLEELSDAVE